MRRLAVGVIGLAACGRIGFDPADDSAGSPPVRSTLTLDRAAITETLVDFPIAVVLDDTRARRDLMAADASDLRFRDRNGAVIAHEIEQLGTPGGASLVAWVRVPRVEGATTTLTVEYGGIPDPVAAGPVWNASYLGVWHMTGSGSVIDSTANRLDGVTSGTTPATGITGGARSFDQNAPDAVVVPGGASLAFAQLTISGWLQARAVPSSVSGFFAVITRQLGTGLEDDFYLGTVGLDAFAGVASPGGGTPFLFGPAIPLTRWTHLAYTYDGTIARVFVDGVVVDSGPAAGMPEVGSGPIYIGCGRNNETGSVPLGVPDVDFVDGLIDEVRLEQVGRSPAWIATEIASMRDELISYGPVEPR